jgi:hypothetical protein
MACGYARSALEWALEGRRLDQMTRLARAASAAAMLVSVVLVPTVAAGQSVGAATDDLQDNDVTFEDGALTDEDLEALDRVVAQLQSDGGYFKVVVLASPADEFSSTRAFAQEVHDSLGGTGRVMVFDPQDVGIASNVPGEASSVNAAEVAAIEAANRSNSFATGVLAAADRLGVEGSGGTVDEEDDGRPTGSAGSSSGSILPLILLFAVIGLVGFGFYLWWSSRKKKASQPLSPVSQAEGEQKVRDEVALASNLVLDLADKVELPDAPKEAVAAFREGASGFADLQDDLEEADTREELEAVYPRLVQARWQLQCAAALLDGQPAPPAPTPGPLFPPPPPPPPGAPPAPEPEVHYRQHTQHSPWLTDAAIAAITVLAARGLGSAMGRGNRRQPSSDDWFRDHYGGGGGFGGGGLGGVFGGVFGGGSRGSDGGRRASGSRPRISMGGRRGRGMGKR